jgi:tight adherence protein B
MMILGCFACAITAVLAFMTPQRARQLFRRLHTEQEPAEAASRTPTGRRWWLLGWSLMAVAVVALRRLEGNRAAVIGIACVLIAATCIRLALQHRRSVAASRARIDVAHACSVLAAQIRVGRVPAEALKAAAEDCPVLAVARSALEMGGDVTQVWRSRSTLPGHAGLADLARAWQVATETGAPLTRALEQVSQALTADQALRMVVGSELAAPRATGKIMAVLPFCGLGLGYLIGGDPVAFLLSSHYGWMCLLLGIALAAAGVLWIDLLAHRAAEQV